jgi:spore coat polysaccharide biosynthesis protein SpsF (cytidylyltransferase family)
MPRNISVLIAVQARSGSKRLPGKSLRLIDDATMISHVFNTAKLSASFVNRASGQTSISAQCCLVIPKEDTIKEHFEPDVIVEGPEDDVLERYRLAFDLYRPDYLVRITGDCPLIIPTIITKHIVSAVGLGLDYCSNAFEDLRTFVDGYDCEVISAKAFDHILQGAKTPFDKEHVTTFLRREKPRWAKFGVVLGHIDLSDIKLSVDTIEDFNEVVRRKKELDKKYDLAQERGYALFRF